MIGWKEYVDQLLKKDCAFEGMDISFAQEKKSICVPPVVKASILILDKMVEKQGKYNLFVFPERTQSIFLFALMKVIHNISEGRIEKGYDPASFSAGDKLKFGNAIFEFMYATRKGEKDFIKIRFSDMTYEAPVSMCPLFQKVDTKRRLSGYDKFVAAKNKVNLATQELSKSDKVLKVLSDYRTHLESSIVYVTTLSHTRELMDDCRINKHELKDLLVIGQTDYTGKVQNITAGQLQGNAPAMVLAADLYNAVSVQENCPVQSVIIDGSNMNSIANQIDALDDLIREGIPVVCVTDTVNSFDLEAFSVRGFNIWRWDADSLTPALCTGNTEIESKAKRCVKHRIEYVHASGPEVSAAMKLLAKHRNATQEQSPRMMKLFERLYSLVFSVLRETIPFSSADVENGKRILEGCVEDLELEKEYVSEEIRTDYLLAIDQLRKIYTLGFKLMKNDALGYTLRNCDAQNVCLIVPERVDQNKVQTYWRRWCLQHSIKARITVLHPTAYYAANSERYDLAIVVGWLRRAIMRKILYSYNSEEYSVLLYNHERHWQKHDARKWTMALKSKSNRAIIDRAFDSFRIDYSESEDSGVDQENSNVAEITDELEEVEQILTANKYRRYDASGKARAGLETVEAVPVNFVGGYLAFYRQGHKLVSATNIILNNAENIKNILPAELKVGDFIVVREADKDLIREMADIHLESNGKQGLREMATKWKEPLAIEQLFCSQEEIIRKLTDAGCTRGGTTILRWMNEEDLISPQKREDLEYIALVTESAVLEELLDKVYEAGKEVKAAHSHAGKQLSVMLQKRIAKDLGQYGEIDPFNIWEPLELSIEGIGPVKVLKVIDVGSPVLVDVSDTNRLIDE